MPHVQHGSDLGQALLDEWPSYFGYGLSFVVIGIMWMNHHEMFRDIERVDHWLMVANILLLLSVSFLPFPTAVLAESLEDTDALRTAMLLYSGTAIANAIFFNVLWLHAVIERDKLLDHHVSRARIDRRTRRYLVGPFVYGITVPLALVTPWLSLALYVAYALFYLIPAGE